MNSVLTSNPAPAGASLKRVPLWRLCLFACAALPAALPGAAQQTTRIQPDPSTGKSLAVVVPGRVSLVHTSDFLAWDEEGNLVGRGDVAVQTETVLDHLDSALALADSSLESAVKLNLSVAEHGLVPAVEQVLARRFESGALPALSLIVGDLGVPGALVGGDAIGTTSASGLTGPPARPERLIGANLHARGSYAHAAVLPRGGARIYLSGKTGRGETVETTRKVLAELKIAMDYAKVDPGDVVQAKVFLQPMSTAPVVAETVREFFGESLSPPLTFVECDNGDGAMEIELIAVGRPWQGDRTERVEYLHPPGLNRSNLFTQVVRVNRGGLIYVSGIYGDPAQPPAEQAAQIFRTLQEAIRAGGGDFRHLAKATYYVTGREGAQGMDVVRANVYEPGRAPAASRRIVGHVGGGGGDMMIDIIGVVVQP